MTTQTPGLPNPALDANVARQAGDRQAQVDELVSALVSSRADNAVLNAEVMQLTAALHLAREQLAAVEQRCRGDLDRQRSRLLTEMLAMFS